MFKTTIGIAALALAGCTGNNVEELGEQQPAMPCAAASDCPRPPRSPEDSPTIDVTDCTRAVCSQGECKYSRVIKGAFVSPWTGAEITCVDGRVVAIVNGHDAGDE